MMRIGVICEGPTDVHAIVNFLGASLTDRGVDPVFVTIQPESDRTKPTDGGWHAVLRWLIGNPPESRVPSYLRDGLFDDGLSAKRCDVLVVQMDADILSDRRFRNWTMSNLGYAVTDPHEPVQRGSVIRSIIEIAGDFQVLSPSESKRHVPAPAVESTETWCVAAFRTLAGDPERLRGQRLCQEFMTALHQSEGRPVQHFAQINKSQSRRRRFCKKHSSGFRRLERSATTTESCWHPSNAKPGRADHSVAPGARRFSMRWT